MPPKDYTEEDVLNALFDISDNGLSLNKAAQKHNVPPSTLSGRRRGLPAKSDSEAQPSNSRLSVAQENTIVEWILRQEKLGCAPSHSAVKNVVTSLLAEADDSEPVGRHWVERFIKRHPEIHTKIGRIQEALRFHEFTPRAVN